MAAESIGRVIATGASNLTLGLQSLVSTARSLYGNNVQLLVANGYGRSYGAPSTVAIRTLPAILESKLWSDLSELEPLPTIGLVTDVGNDVLYGFEPERIVGWVEDTLERMIPQVSRVVLTDLPVHSVQRLSESKFLFFRTLFFPFSRLSRSDVVERVLAVSAGLADLARRKQIRLMPLKAEWYGIDPIHVRPGSWTAAWSEILSAEAGPGRSRFSPLEWLALQTRAPQQRWLAGIERRSLQTGRRLRGGGRLWLY